MAEIEKKIEEILDSIKDISDRLEKLEAVSILSITEDETVNEV